MNGFDNVNGSAGVMPGMMQPLNVSVGVAELCAAIVCGEGVGVCAATNAVAAHAIATEPRIERFIAILLL
jgi:hypothetical protein